MAMVILEGIHLRMTQSKELKLVSLMHALTCF
jgi:hypothetical protein